MQGDLWLETSKGDTLSLYSPPIMVEDGWVPASTSGGLEPSRMPLWETIPILIRGTAEQIKQAIREIHLFERTAIWYNLGMERNDAVRLCLQDGDGVVHTTVVIDADTSQSTQVGTSAWLDEGDPQQVKYTLKLKRVPYWEKTTPDNQTFNSVSSWGGTGTLSNLYGTRHARVDYGYINGSNIGRTWLGIRKEREGLSHFDPVIEIEDGTSYIADTTFQTKTGGSGGTPNCARTTFGTSTLLTPRAYVHLTDWADVGYEDHFVGEYLVLARVLGDTVGSKFGIQLRSGYLSSNSYAVHNEVLFEVTTADYWRIVPLGTVSIPPVPRPEFGSGVPQELVNFVLAYAAERVATGSGNNYLFFDGFVLMPLDHLMVVTRGPIVGSVNKYWFYTRAEGERHLLLGESAVDTPDFQSEAAFDHWRVPLDASKFVLVVEAGGSAPQHVIYSTITVFMQWYSRSHQFGVDRP